MAGLGRQVFTAGEVLTAADVNGYLMDQAVMVFANIAARTSAISSPSDGMMSYLVDLAQVYLYDGSAWVAVDTTASGLATLVVDATTARTLTSRRRKHRHSSRWQSRHHRRRGRCSNSNRKHRNRCRCSDFNNNRQLYDRWAVFSSNLALRSDR